MPKRKQSDSDYDHLARKLKKLQRKIKHARRHHKSTSSLESDTPRTSPESKSVTDTEDVYKENEVYSPGCSSWLDPSESGKNISGDKANYVVPPSDTCHSLRSTVTVAPEVTARPPQAAFPEVADIDTANSAAEAGSSGLSQLQLPPNDIAGAAASTPDTDASSEPVLELDTDIMDILGADPTFTKDYGPEIQKDLAIRINHIVTSGISKENRKEIKDKYLVPSNCKLMKAPSLNPEIRAALVETQAKRDKGIENKQNMTSCALSSLSAAITMLLKSNNKNPELLKLLMDTARILSDMQHSDSILRRFFILSTVKKDLKEQLEKTKIDEMLFGSNLAEALKSAKTISKSGADIRSASATKPATQAMTKTPARSLNYRPPPASRQPTAAGAARGAHQPPPPPVRTARLMTTRPMQHSATRTSWRQPPAPARPRR